MDNKIVFYIRALFHESIMPGNEKTNKPSVSKLIEAFNQYSNISAQDYRKEVHKIQLQNLSHISNRIIYNNAEENLHKKYNYTFCVLQNQTIKKLQELNDDDWVIPLDDDDWLSPEILNKDFKENMLNGWHTVSFRHTNKKLRPFFHIKSEPLPKKLETEEQITHAKGWLSNCQCIPAFVIKRLIEESRMLTLQDLLQRHSRVRIIIREEPLASWNLTEHFFDEVLSVYVRHAANITLLEKLTAYNEETKYTRDLYNQTVKDFKNTDYTNVLDLPDHLNWTLPYLNQLRTLNQLL